MTKAEAQKLGVLEGSLKKLRLIATQAINGTATKDVLKESTIQRTDLSRMRRSWLRSRRYS